VRPPNSQTEILLARADGDFQRAVVGGQVAGRVGFLLRVDEFDDIYQRMAAGGVRFATEPRTEPYRCVVVLRDTVGNR
jgi:hypothetical protein